jgi:hypothetical protein
MTAELDVFPRFLPAGDFQGSRYLRLVFANDERKRIVSHL